MTLPAERRMTLAQLATVMASGVWTWRCASRAERDQPGWRLVERLGPVVFLRVPVKGTL